MLIILLCLKKIRPTNLKAPKFKINDRVLVTNYKNMFNKGGYTENWSR